MDPECALTPLQECECENWHAFEVSAVQEFARELLLSACAKGEPAFELTFESVLISLARVRFDFETVLNEIRDSMDKSRLAEIVRVTESMSGRILENAYWSMTTKGTDRFVRWLYSNETLAAILKAIESDIHPQVNEVLEKAFEHLTV